MSKLNPPAGTLAASFVAWLEADPRVPEWRLDEILGGETGEAVADALLATLAAGNSEIRRLQKTEAVLRDEITRLRRTGTGAALHILGALSIHTEDALRAAGIPLSKEPADD